MENNTIQIDHLKFGYYSSLLLTILTLVTFAFAMTAIPPAGPYCPENCMAYPFSDLLLYYPRDYYWMYLAIFQLFAFIIFITVNHFIAITEKKLFTFLSLAFTLISSTVLLIAYYTQFSTVPMSMMNGETEGIALLSQYNGHGIFIAMEELGFISMSIALFFLAFAFSKKTKLEKIIRFILTMQIFLTVLSFVFYSLKHGIERSYRFEVAVISIDWLVLITIGILISIHFKRRLNQNYAL